MLFGKISKIEREVSNSVFGTIARVFGRNLVSLTMANAIIKEFITHGVRTHIIYPIKLTEPRLKIRGFREKPFQLEIMEIPGQPGNFRI